MRKRAKRNPSGATWAVLGIGAVGVGVGAWYLFFRNPAPAGSISASAPTPTAPTASTPAALPPAGRPFGDPADPNSAAYACNTYWKLMKIGHPREAAYWGEKCATAGATVPTSDATTYR